MQRTRKLATVLSATALAALAINLQAPTVDAADHVDGAIADDAPADLADFYAWEEGDNIIAIMTFNPLLEAGAEAVYDDGVLYTLNIDNTADPAVLPDFLNNTNDNEADIQVHVRFGQNGLEEWGAQVIGLPGAAEDPLVGPVTDDIGAEGARVRVGIFDDPFFFDFDGFTNTFLNLIDDADAADLAFAGLAGPDATVDFFETNNIMAIVMEFPSAMVTAKDGDPNFLQMWASTGRVVER